MTVPAATAWPLLFCSAVISVSCNIVSITDVLFPPGKAVRVARRYSMGPLKRTDGY